MIAQTSTPFDFIQLFSVYEHEKQTHPELFLCHSLSVSVSLSLSLSLSSVYIPNQSHFSMNSAPDERQHCTGSNAKNDQYGTLIELVYVALVSTCCFMCRIANDPSVMMMMMIVMLLLLPLCCAASLWLLCNVHRQWPTMRSAIVRQRTPGVAAVSDMENRIAQTLIATLLSVNLWIALADVSSVVVICILSSLVALCSVRSSLRTLLAVDLLLLLIAYCGHVRYSSVLGLIAAQSLIVLRFHATEWLTVQQQIILEWLSRFVHICPNAARVQNLFIVVLRSITVSFSWCEYVILCHMVGCILSLTLEALLASGSDVVVMLPFDIIRFIISDRVHWILAVFWLLCIALMVAVLSTADNTNAADSKRSGTVVAVPLFGITLVVEKILLRKFFHLMVLFMFIPGTVLRPYFMALSYVAALLVFVAVEMVRLVLLHAITDTSSSSASAAVHLFGKHLDATLRKFTDERDGGPLILTHIYLLVGCALPLWIDLAFVKLSHAHPDPLFGLMGVLVLGVGDTMASVTGIRMGRHRIHRYTRKTVEGTLGAIVAVVLASLAIVHVFSHHLSEHHHHQANTNYWTNYIVTVLATCLYEALTTQIDNLVIPLFGAGMLASLTQFHRQQQRQHCN